MVPRKSRPIQYQGVLKHASSAVTVIIYVRQPSCSPRLTRTQLTGRLQSSLHMVGHGAMTVRVAVTGHRSLRPGIVTCVGMTHRLIGPNG
jgi:hypothetical protein